MTTQGDIAPGRGGESSAPPGAPGWLNPALTGVVLSSALVAALDTHDLSPRPLDDVAWILITLVCTSLVRAYAGYVAGRGRDVGPGPALRVLRREWPLPTAGLPAVAVLLAGVATPALPLIRVVLATNVVVLFGLGTLGAARAGHGRVRAVLLGLADALLGVLVIVANALLR